MTFAILNIAGTQERAEKGAKLRIPLLSEKKEGEVVTFEEILLFSDEKGGIKVGTPFVTGASVTGKVLSHEKDEKIRVFRMKHRKRMRRTQGHRQKFTMIEVMKVEG